MRALLAILLITSSGCYLRVLRRHAADIVDRRVAEAQEEAERALDVLAPKVGREDGTKARVVVDVSEADVEDVAEIIETASTALGKISDSMAVTGAWTEAMKDDAGRVKPEKQIELGSDEERHTGCQYAGRAKSRSFIVAFFRGAWERVTTIARGIKWTWRALKFVLAAACSFFAVFGAWQWLGKRRERAGRRESADILADLMKNGDQEKIDAALNSAPHARERYEADRAWRKKRERNGVPNAQQR